MRTSIPKHSGCGPHLKVWKLQTETPGLSTIERLVADKVLAPHLPSGRGGGTSPGGEIWGGSKAWWGLRLLPLCLQPVSAASSPIAYPLSPPGLPVAAVQDHHQRPDAERGRSPFESGDERPRVPLTPLVLPRREEVNLKAQGRVDRGWDLETWPPLPSLVARR